ncbi:MAG TPA: sensor domain-containing protein [Trebonia sp.]|nr:sensor domain-containing protein [Trebonia sp.]
MAASPGRGGNWASRGTVAAGRGIALVGLTLVGVVLWVAFATAVTLAPLGIGLSAIPVTVRAIRRLETRVRRLSGDWRDAAIADPYRPAPAGREGQPPGFWARLVVLVADPATWRDLMWITVDTLVGWLLALTPAGLLAWGLFGVIMPAVWHPIVAAHGNNWYAFIHVTTVSTAWLSVALGIAFIALGLLTAPGCCAATAHSRGRCSLPSRAPNPKSISPNGCGLHASGRPFLSGRPEAPHVDALPGVALRKLIPGCRLL